MALAQHSTQHDQSSQPSSYTISGKVVNENSGLPLAGAEVAIVPVVNGTWGFSDEDVPRLSRRGGRRGPARSALDAVLTSSDGEFAFDHVPAGKYSLEASRRGFITSSYQEHGMYSTAIVAGAGLGTDGLTLKLSPGAVISGSATDSSGDPIEQAAITLYRQSDDGLGTIRTYRASNSDDLGAFEFAHLQPGTYFVSAKATVWYASPGRRQAQADPSSSDTAATPVPVPATNLDLVYPRAFYADATEADAATPIPIRGGEHLRIDLHLQAVPAVHLTYSLPPSGSPNGVHTFSRQPALFQSVFGEREGAGYGMTMTQENQGTAYVSYSVAPGEYEAEVGGRTVSVNAGGGDAVLDAASGIVPVEITGKLGPVAGATLPETMDVTLQPSDARGNSPLSTVAHDGAYHFEQVRPGAYELEAQAQGRPMAIVQIAASGAQVSGHVLEVGTQPVALAATVAPESVILNGFAHTPLDEGDRAASGVMVVLVPEHLGDHALYRRDQSDSDGSFALRQVAPGSYTLVAIRDGWDLEWARPEVISHYLPLGEPVTVTTANSGVVRLAEPVRVQPR